MLQVLLELDQLPGQGTRGPVGHRQPALQVAVDIDLGQGVADRGGQGRIGGFKADIDELTAADRRHLKVGAKLADQPVAQVLWLGRRWLGRGRGPKRQRGQQRLQQAGFPERGVIFGVCRDPQPVDDLLGQMARLQDAVLGLEILIVGARDAIDLLDGDHVFLLGLDQDRGGRLVNGRQAGHKQRGQQGNDAGKAQDRPFIIQHDAQIFAQVRPVILLPFGRDAGRGRFLGVGLVQKKLSSTVIISPGRMKSSSSAGAGRASGSVSWMTLILSLEARSRKPPAIEIALRTVTPG